MKLGRRIARVDPGLWRVWVLAARARAKPDDINYESRVDARRELCLSCAQLLRQLLCRRCTLR